METTSKNHKNMFCHRLALSAASTIFGIAASAQIHLTADLQNNHLWRGMEVADGCVILADLGYTFLDGHATLGLWGGTNTDGSYKEFNHYVTIRGGGFEFCAMDTYNFSPSATYNNHQYFNYSAHQTGRFLNCTLNYRFQEPRFPLLLSWSTIMFGRDRSADNTSQKYSSFAYAEYPIYRKDKWTVDAGVGAAFALNKAGEKQNFYGNTSGIVHAQLKVSHDLKLGSYTIPVHVMALWNPQSQKAYFQIGAQIIHL